MKTRYYTYSVLIRHAGFIEVVAIDHEAMLADIAEAYADADVITWSVR